MKTLQPFLRALCAVAWLSSTLAFAADELPPVDTFFRLPQYDQMKISPDGMRIGALAPVKGRQNLVVMSLSPRAVNPVTAIEDHDVLWFVWLNDKRLLLGTGSRGTREDDRRGGAIYAVDRDGSNARLISEGGDSAVRAVIHPLVLVRTLPGDGDDFIAQEYSVDGRRIAAGGLYRIDSRSGRRTLLSLGKPEGGESEAWVVDNKGVARAMVASAEGISRIYYRAGADAPWQKLDEFSATVPGWMPLAIGEDDKSLIASSRKGRDKAAIVRYDPATRSFGEILAEHPQVDLNDLLVDRDGSIVGVRYLDDRGGYAMFDPALAKVQKDVDGGLPGSVNHLSWSTDRAHFVIDARSDVSPGVFYLMDARTGRIQWFADRAPWIKPKEMSPMQPVRYKARDGLIIPAYLTVPRAQAAKALPMVIVIHGGPWVEGDTWSFDPEAQFLASRGYAVLQPNFRGTTRYGWKHFQSSFGQWGLSMQDDITDAVKWAVDEGIADPKRICIYGASYGGYATMMGLAKTPELFRCGINYVGVTDIPFFLTVSWSDYAYSDWIRSSVKTMVGDADRDAQRLRDTSPVNLASRIRVPVLMAYGASDRRVPLEHGTRMRAALDRAGVKYQWMVMEGEGHGFRDPANQRTFYSAMEKFLAENLK
jgi:dipeptidyl aminopeptidase/acylaminoacyl peptidase